LLEEETVSEFSPSLASLVKSKVATNLARLPFREPKANLADVGHISQPAVSSGKFDQRWSFADSPPILPCTVDTNLRLL
jgi:hypothetical protein